MKDRLPRKRINWIDVLCWCIDVNKDFSSYCKKHKKVRSLNKLAYLFLLSSRGRSFIAEVRKNPDQYSMSQMIRISHTPWVED